ncbi:hypothetical protein HFP72_09915 [Nocardiopsis sp. ARC36]
MAGGTGDSRQHTAGAVVRDLDGASEAGGGRDLLGELQNALDGTARGGRPPPGRGRSSRGCATGSRPNPTRWNAT